MLFHNIVPIFFASTRGSLPFGVINTLEENFVLRIQSTVNTKEELHYNGTGVVNLSIGNGRGI